MGSGDQNSRPLAGITCFISAEPSPCPCILYFSLLPIGWNHILTPPDFQGIWKGEGQGKWEWIAVASDEICQVIGVSFVTPDVPLGEGVHTQVKVL